MPQTTHNMQQITFDWLLPSNEWLTVAQFAASIGRSHQYVIDQIESGHLAAYAARSRRARRGESRTAGRKSYLIHRKDASLWLAEAYTGEPDDTLRRVLDLVDRLPRQDLAVIHEHLGRRVR